MADVGRTQKRTSVDSFNKVMRPTGSFTFAFGKETLNFILNINLLLTNKTNEYEKNFDDAISIRWHVGNGVVYEY